MFRSTKRVVTGVIGVVSVAVLSACSGGLDALGGLTSGVRIETHMADNSSYEAVDDEALKIDLGNIDITAERRAWFSLTSIGNAPVLIEALNYRTVQGDGWLRPQLKRDETVSAYSTPHTLEARDQYLIEVPVAPMVAGRLQAELEIVIQGVETVVVTVVAQAVDGSQAVVDPAPVTVDLSPDVVGEPNTDSWTDEPSEEPVDPEPVVTDVEEETEPEPEPEVEEESVPEEGEVGVDGDEQLPEVIDTPEPEDVPEVDSSDEPDPVEDDEPETLIGGNLLADDEGEEVIVTCVAKGGGYNHELYLDNTNTFICNSANVGTQVNLGVFPAGTELVFRLDVLTSGYSYYTGAADRNPDDTVHVRIDSVENGTYRFGFEDLYGGGDEDYDDCVFEVSGSDADWLE